jgi:type I site-specific restriction-modification system R (restriction) subunit
VDDQATVPPYYDARGVKLGVASGDLNERIAAKLEELETDNIDVKQRLEKEEAGIGDEQEELFRYRQLHRMRETKVAVVREEQGEIEKFHRWDLDIIPHRKLMKEGIDLPESMLEKPEFHNLQTMALDDAFKADEQLLRVAIACATWLTGFDMPSLAMLYLDSRSKPAPGCRPLPVSTG